MKNRLTTFFFSITSVTIVLIPMFLVHYFEAGLENSAKIGLLTEVSEFSSDYKKSKVTPLPSSYVFNFNYDDLPELYVKDINILEGLKINTGDFIFVFSDDFVQLPFDDERIVLVHKHQLYDGRILYGVAKYNIGRKDSYIIEWIDKQEKLTVSILFIYLASVVLALWYYNSKVEKKTTELVEWSERISSNFSSEVKPNFKFREFNRVASCLESALEKNAKLIEREQKFLSHASHELRTPIAIIRANMEILDRMELVGEASEPINRIDRASTNMQLLTETLLWLGRQSENSPVETNVELAELLSRLIEEQSYLIQGESVEVIHSYADAPKLMLPVTPLLIVLSNLIRNAFQYTHHGWIKVVYRDSTVLIENHDLDLVADKDVVSFGLGLELTQKVCTKLGWTLELENCVGGMRVKLLLPCR